MWIVGSGVLFAILAALIGHSLISWRLGDSQAVVARAAREVRQTCLLYTSDAADE